MKSLTCVVRFLRPLGVVLFVCSASPAGANQDYSHAGSMEDVPVIGVDSHGEPMVQKVVPGHFLSTLTKTIQSMHAGVLPVLEGREREVSSRRSSPAVPIWSLRTVAVGLGGTLAIGLGSYLKLQAKPRLRMVFTNSSNPNFPD